CRWLVSHDRPTATACVIANDKGDDQTAIALGACERIDPAFVQDALPLIESAKVMITPLEHNLDAVVAALRLAGTHGVLRIMNPAPSTPAVHRRLLSLADVMVAHESHVAALLKHFCGAELAGTFGRHLKDTELHEMLRRIA